MVTSIDDFYLTHADQSELASKYPTNPLVQHRGQPGTHDLPLAQQTLSSLRDRQKVQIPVYDKSAFNGQGDRTDSSVWESFNDSEPSVDVVLIEGWCVGFRPLSDAALEEKHARAVEEENNGKTNGQLCKHRLENLRVINEALRRYDAITE